MFEDSLIESAGVLKTKRPAATAASLLLQCMLVAVLAALPLLYTEALPLASVVSFWSFLVHLRVLRRQGRIQRGTPLLHATAT